ncbi:DUF2892 domain-containing protein [Rudanella paleaurantiibacter]|uniref:DUF2892 domain-containing protein n=1 Tax=Rudanella paleaurantiibacter TaxID=2614655 RepID=A0A7J5TYU8_9BACT|nr:DUF2892 domain-containing protein [Rudanella paleaurantiibacter]KAB7730329.1 DUF2892 domain-containing protein [Rudanella paleaurantiibacter]
MSFVKNVGFVDQMVRALLIIDILVAYLMGFITGLSAFMLAALALVLTVTCLMGYCPVYRLLGLSTRHEEQNTRL